MKEIQRKNIKWWVGTIACVALFSIIGIFAYTKMSFIVKGVQIEAMIENNNGSSIVEIKGNAKNAVYLTLNGREIYIEKNGNFSEPIALLPGLGVISINAKDKFGKSAEKKFEVIYKKDAGAIAFNNKKL